MKIPLFSQLLATIEVFGFQAGYRLTHSPNHPRLPLLFFSWLQEINLELFQLLRHKFCYLETPFRGKNRIAFLHLLDIVFPSASQFSFPLLSWLCRKGIERDILLSSSSEEKNVIANAAGARKRRTRRRRSIFTCSARRSLRCQRKFFVI